MAPTDVWIRISSRMPRLQERVRRALGGLVDELGGGPPLWVLDGNGPSADLLVLSGIAPRLEQLGVLRVVGGAFWTCETSSPAELIERVLPEDWLRDYQRDLAARLLGARLGRGVIKAPTGSGKTRVLTAVLKAGQAIGIRRWVLAAPNRELLQQIEQTARPVLGLAMEDVHLVTLDGLASRVRETWADGLLVDECHRIGARSYAVGLERVRACWRLGVSATPFDRGDGSSLVAGLLGPLVGEVSRVVLEERGYVARAVVRAIKV